MRPRALVLLSIWTIALSVASSSAGAQRVFSRDCRARFGWGRSPISDCSYDYDIAREARQAAARARAEARASARWARGESRSYALAARAIARADARAWERAMTQNRFRTNELRARLRDRFDSRFYDRGGRYFRRW